MRLLLLALAAWQFGGAAWIHAKAALAQRLGERRASMAEERIQQLRTGHRIALQAPAALGGLALEALAHRGRVDAQGGQGAFSTSARDFALDIESKYATAGFNFKDGDWKITGLLVDSKSDYLEASNNIVLTQNAPGLVVKLDSQRLPSFIFPSAYNPENASSYVQAQLQYRPSATFNTERQGKLDLQYTLDNPWFSRLWFGGQARESTSKQYNGGGYLASNGTDLVSTADDVNVRGANINQTIIWDPLYTGSAQRPNDTQTYINRNHSTRYVNSAAMQQLVASMRTRSPSMVVCGRAFPSRSMPAPDSFRNPSAM